MWAGRSMIVGAPEFIVQFRYVAQFQDEGDTNVIRVEC